LCFSAPAAVNVHRRLRLLSDFFLRLRESRRLEVLQISDMRWTNCRVGAGAHQ
jgi:hypothetical protein